MRSDTSVYERERSKRKAADEKARRAAREREAREQES
jgi:hypothetical protein